MKLSETPTIHPTATVTSSALGRWTEIGAHTSFAMSELGDYSYIVEYGQVLFTTVGKFCSIAAQVRLNPSNHPMERASQHHFTYRSDDYFADGDRDEAVFAWRRADWVTVGHDVWIGHGVTVMPGVTIGTGAVVGAGAVVTRHVDPYTIAVGVPARPLRPRFEPAIAARMEALGWWDWPHEQLRAALPDFRTLGAEAFLEKHGG